MCMDKNTNHQPNPEATMTETIIGYTYYDAGDENTNLNNGHRRFWLTERLTRDAGRTTYNGKTTLCSAGGIELYKEAGFKLTEIED